MKWEMKAKEWYEVKKGIEKEQIKEVETKNKENEKTRGGKRISDVNWRKGVATEEDTMRKNSMSRTRKKKKNRKGKQMDGLK